MSLTFFMIAGEASADLYGAALLRELKKEMPDVHCFGVGGKACAAAGMEVSVDAAKLNVVGLSDWFDRLGEVVSSYRQLGKLIRARRPDCAILLDLPDLNLRMARKLKALGVPVVYYISPQVWAWRRYRVKTIKKLVDRMLVLFPFEKAFYEGHGVDAKFVGHPLLEIISPRGTYRSPSEIQAAPRIALLPGSRRSELRFHLPILRPLVRKLYERYPQASFQLPVASTIPASLLEGAFPDCPVTLVEGDSHQVLADADFAVVASGTATLETALIGTPFCLFYRVSRSSVWLFRTFVGYRDFIGMPNLLHGREVVREFFQEKADVEWLFPECQRLVEDHAYREQMARSLRECRERLGASGASQRAAQEVYRVLKSQSPLGRSLASDPAVS